MGKLVLGNLLLGSTIWMSAASASEWGAAFEDMDRKVKIGGRIQAIAEDDSEKDGQDFYLRRVRLNLEYSPWENHKFVYDIRNDSSNKGDKGDGKFSIGDAYWGIKVKNPYIKNIKLFRAKVDVSYSQTSSSRNLLNPDRADISEHASDFIVANRRAANAQVNGNVGNLAFHLVISDGVQSGDLETLEGSKSVEKVNSQNFTYGGKFRYYFLGYSRKNKVQDTFYGEVDTFSIGLGHFINDKINTQLDDATELTFRRTLTNVDLSYAYKNFRLLGEYFEFEGDLLNLDESSKSKMLGKSGGYYLNSEYVVGKWAPNLGYELFDRNLDESEYKQKSYNIGLNYYDLNASRRYGFTYKKTENEDGLGGETFERLYGHIMLNF